ncbi:transposase [Glutamicibacter mishrai]|uniref:transposase n=1 Tax=Glutamicibacter mishrai TaxID=1775880 RepID=UPI0020CB820C|nr:transposase [Glutamicibacter mishrai]UTT40240.1 transposase [Glutamicibacter mishrai]UTT40291.1 transposase [Glutamicibacter mishrai]
MGAPRKYTDKQRAEALRLYELEGPTAVAQKLGIPKGTVAQWAKQSGTQTVRNERTAHAVEAVQVDNKLRRQNIAARLYSQAETTLDVLEAPEFKTMKRSEGGAEYPTTLDFIPSADRRTLVQTVQIALKTTHEIDARDNDNGMTAGRSMLEKLAEQLGAMPVVDPDSGQGSGGSESAPVELPSDE